MRIRTREWLSAAGLYFGLMSATWASDASLFEPGSLLARNKEAAVLNAEERKTLAFVRSKPDVFVAPQVFKFNSAALGSGVISVALPNGKQVQFVGAMGTKPGHEGVWYGKSAAGGEMFLASNETGTTGNITEGGEAYQVASLAGKRFHWIARVLPHRFTEDPNAPREDPRQRATLKKGGTK